MPSVNKKLFEQARVKKNELNYKFLWTKNGYVHLHYNEQSPIHKITSDEHLHNLPRYSMRNNVDGNINLQNGE